ncbi:MAG TPA: hypothetical protein VF273_04650 [Pelobium sp.]
METKSKKWESGPVQETDDQRTKEQLERAKQETERKKENLDDKGEGSFKEKNGDENQQYSGINSEPKLDKRPTKTTD